MTLATVQTIAADIVREPLLIGGLTALAAAVIGWFGIQTLAVLKKVDRIAIAIWGDDNDPEPNGLKREVRRVNTTLTEHVGRQENFNDAITRAIAEHHRLLERRAEPRPVDQ